MPGIRVEKELQRHLIEKTDEGEGLEEYLKRISGFEEKDEEGI